MADTQEQLLTEITTLEPTDLVRVVDNPITLPDSAVMRKAKFVDSLFADMITPTVNGATPDWAPTGLANAHYIRIFPSGPASISGITTGAGGRVLILQNAGSSLVSLLDESTLSLAVNRFSLPGTAIDFVLAPDMMVIIAYDPTASRWKIVSAGAGVPQDGWTPLGAFFSFVSADGATAQTTVAKDITNLIQRGTRIRYNQTHSLTAYWNFDASSASQVGSFPGTDTAMTYTAGKFSNAATFNGTTSKIAITDTASLKPTGEFTVGVWFKSSVSGIDQVLFQSYSQNTNLAGFLIRIDSTNVIAAIIGKNTGTVAEADYKVIRGKTTVTDGNWHYLVFTFRNNYVQVYLDGVLDSSEYCYAPVYAATNYVRVGCRNNAGTDMNFINGQIDDLYLMNGYALDEQTIKAKYQAQTAQGTSSMFLTKYAIITDIGIYNGTNTPVTLWGGTDFTTISGTLGTPYFSNLKCPSGFNTNPQKWSVVVVDTTLRSVSGPIINTFYSPGNLQIVVPIGAWRLYHTLKADADRATAGPINIFAALSTSVTGFTDLEYQFAFSHGSSTAVGGSVALSKTVILPVKTTFYPVMYTSVSGLATIHFVNTYTTWKVEAICAYL